MQDILDLPSVTPNISEKETVEDCISREAVDEYITNLLSGYLYDEERTRLEDLTAYIWEMPSVQPCEDCISRQAVHEMLENIPVNESDKWFNWLQKACLRLAELPSVTPQPTRPTARWETFVEDYNKCSKCGEMGKFYRIYKYCPNCGARMEAEA
jgi:NADH pyrophosphatase NudC (nudix superfamily)